MLMLTTVPELIFSNLYNFKYSIIDDKYIYN